MGLKLDGICTNQQLDSSGETLNVAGHDISDFLEDKAVVNWEHEKGAEDIIGHVIHAKKILKESDCADDRQKMFWDISGGPYVYIVAELYEDEQHPGAVACAAMVRYYAKRKEKMFIGWSVEGQTLERDGNKLERSVGRRVAFTLRPCNKSAMMGVFEDPKSAGIVQKYESYTPTHKEFQISSTIFEDASRKSPKKALNDLKKAITVLNKTLEAGNYNVAPGQLTGGAALQVEDRSLKNRAKAAIRDWNRARPLKEVLKAALPEVSESYIEHFVDLAHEMHLRKNVKPLVRITAHHSPNAQQDEHQMKLIEGLYMDPQREHYPEHNNFSNKVYKLQNDAGQKVLVKPPIKVQSIFGETQGAHNSTVYHKLAKDFFGMGDHVPATNYFHNPSEPMQAEHKDGAGPWQAMEFLDNAQTALVGGYEKVMNKNRQDGTLHKLAMMDLITGHPDRHFGNVMYDDNNKIYHIDNDYAFNHEYKHAPHYFFGSDPLEEDPHPEFPGIGEDRIHVHAKQWLDQLDPRKLVSIMLKHGMDRPRIENSVRALKMAKLLTDQGKNFNDIHSAMTEDWE